MYRRSSRKRKRYSDSLSNLKDPMKGPQWLVDMATNEWNKGFNEGQKELAKDIKRLRKALKNSKRKDGKRLSHNDRVKLEYLVKNNLWID